MEKPNLPESTEWPEETQEWFSAWRESKRTDNWDMCQWQYMFDTAIVHALIYQAEQFNYLCELRARLSYLGLTFEPPQEDIKPAIATPIQRIKEQYDKGHKRKQSTTSA